MVKQVASQSVLEGLPPDVVERALRDPELAKLIFEERRRAVERSLVSWCTEALAPVNQSPARHHRLLCKELEAVETGEVDRLMILAPPGSAKSTYASVLFPVWWFRRNPRTAVIAASHTGDLAEDFGRRVRNTVSENADILGYSLSVDSQAAGKWNTNAGGEYRTFGVGKAIAGRRADLCVIDDPVSGREAADSESDRNRVWKWYIGDVYNRLKPGGRIVLIMTRWHEDDLGGRLLQEAETGGDKWRVLSLPALAEPKPGKPDPLHRRTGMALWPEWENEEALDRKRRVSGEREWASQFQQRPTPTDGILFKEEFLKKVPSIPFGDKIETECRGWDLAATEQTGTRNPDWTVGVRIARLTSGRYLVTDVVRMRGSPSDVESIITETTKNDGPDVIVSIPQDPGQAGKAQVTYLAGQLAGHIIKTNTETGSKSTRAMPVASQAEVGNLLFLDRSWTETMFSEMKTFPSGLKDDQVDALSRAFSHVALAGNAQMHIDHMRAQINGVEEDRLDRLNRAGGQRKMHTADQSLIKVYRETIASLSKPSVVCFRCRLPVDGTRIDDGVSIWHPQCV